MKMDEMQDAFEEKVLDGLLTLSNEISNEGWERFKKWMLKEYRYYPMTSREGYSETLTKMVDMKIEQSKIAEYLREEINFFGGPRLFYRVALKLKGIK